jgi:hypothetical protein
VTQTFNSEDNFAVSLQMVVILEIAVTKFHSFIHSVVHIKSCKKGKSGELGTSRVYPKREILACELKACSLGNYGVAVKTKIVITLARSFVQFSIHKKE